MPDGEREVELATPHESDEASEGGRENMTEEESEGSQPEAEVGPQQLRGLLSRGVFGQGVLDGEGEESERGREGEEEMEGSQP